MPWSTIPVDADIAVFRALDGDEEPNGPVAGIEIMDFLDFNRWEDLPRFPFLWELAGWGPLPLDDLLRRVQRELRAESFAASSTSSRRS